MRRIGFLVVLILLCALGAAAQAPNTISTVAGGGTNPTSATSAYLPGAYGIVRDAVTGNTYVSLEYFGIVYKLDSSGNITPYAGTGIAGFSGDGSAATSAQLNSPSGLAVDSSGNLFIADANNNRIRRVDVNSHVITTVAGSGNQYNGIGFFGGFSGDGSPATGALMNFPRGVAVDPSGNLYIADTNNNRIRMVDNSPDRIITTYAGNGGGCGGQTDTIGDGCPAVQGTLNQPLSVTIHSSGDLYIADSSNNLVRKVDNSANHIITVYAGGSGAGCTGQADSVGDGCPATQAALSLPSGVFVDASENVFISDTNHERIRRVDTTTNHIITSVAGNGSLCTSLTVAPANCGNGGAATSALLNTPSGVFVDGLENILYADLGTNRFRLISAGTTPTISNYAGGGSGGDGGVATAAVMGIPFVVSADSAGDLFLVENGGYRIRKVNAATQDITSYVGNGIAGAPGAANGDGGPATQANISNIAVYGMALDPSGNLYFTDANNRVVRRVDAQTGLVTLVAGTYGQHCTNGTCGDGGPATSATFIFPDGVAVGSNGDVYIADAANNRIRVVTMDGAVPGNISNFAGTGQPGPPTNGVALTATLNFPGGMVFDANGNLYFADSGNNVIRKIDTGGNISTVAFNGIPTFGGDGGPALNASMFSPTQVAFDAAGNLFVGGGFDNVVRRIDAQAQSVITVAGDIDNLDGGFNGDGGPAPQSLLSNFGLAVITNATTHVNTLYIADPGNNRTRKVILAPIAVVNSSLLMPFGPVLAGASSISAPVTITNNGLDDLIVSNVSVPAGFTLSNTCQIPGAPPTPVAPGAECVLLVAFTPPAGTPGGTPFNGNLTFSTNDSSNPSFSAALSGSVPALPAVQLTVTLAGSGSGTVTSGVPGLGPTSGVPTPINCPTQACAVDYAAGQQVTLIALGNPGSALTGWTVNGSTTTCPGVTPTCTVTMSAAQIVTANFGPSSITVSAMGNGSGTITITPGGPTCTVTNGAITSGPCTADFGANDQLTITAKATGTSSFSGWLGFCGLIGSNDSGTGPCNVPSSISGITVLNGATVTAVFSGPAQTFGQGDVFVGTIDGMIFEYKPNGTLVQVLNSGNLGGIIAGMNFDTSGNLYAANPGTTAVTGGTVEFFGNNGTGPTTFGTAPYNSNPLGVLVAPTGNIFVGQSAGQNSLLEMSSGGAVNFTFFPAYDTAGIGYIELLDDGGRVLYTSATAGSSELGTVKNFDIANNNQNPDFATNLPGGPAFAIRELSDKSVLVANTTKIVHLDPNGNILTTPSLTPPGNGIFYALNLNPDGQSFWAGDALSGKVYQVQISSGNVLATINTGLGFNSSALSFSTIFGIAVFGQPQSGGADVAVTMTAAPNPVAQNSNLNYTITVTNNGPLNAANVTATDVLPAGVTFVSSVTSQGSCSGTTTVTCNLGTINSGASPQVITIVATATTAGTVANTVNVTSTTADPNVTNNSATTSTTVTSSSNPVLAITKTHTGNFTQGQSGATYTVTVSDGAGAGPTNGTVTVTDAIPTGLTLTSMAGTGWTCTANSCTRSDVLTAGLSYPAITVTVSVASNAPASVVNAVSASGGGSATANATDTTTITSSTGTGNGVATVTPSSFAFGGVQIGTSVPQTFSLSNTGTGPLGSIVISIPSVASFGSLDYAITSNTCPASLAANSAPCTFTVSFTPSFAAPDPGSVLITDDSSVGPTTVLLSGTGVGSAYVLPFEIFYDGQTPGTTSPAQTATLFNVSDSTVGINGITFVGNAASDFSLVNNQCANSLSSGSNCTMGVVFTPSTTVLGPRTADLTIATNATSAPLVSHLTGNGAIRHLPGFTGNVLPPNDDQSTNEISLPFTLNFFGTNFTSLFVNNNGNVTFGGACGGFTPSGLTGNLNAACGSDSSTPIAMVAAYWADVDTTGAIPGLQVDPGSPPSGVVTFGVDTVNGHKAFGVDYENVGYFGSHTNKLNSFQLILIDRSDTGIPGAFDIELNYDKIQWEAGDASQGANGLCTMAAECAAVGYTNGTGTPGTNFQLNGSFTIGALLDNGPAATSLIHNDLGSTMLGRYEFQVRNGIVEPTLTVTVAGTGTGTVSSNPAGITMCGTTCSANFVSGTQVTLTATPAAGSTFTGWSGASCEGTSPCTFTITTATSVTANFSPGTNNFALTVTDAGTGSGTVSSNPAGINMCATTCSANFAGGTAVTLTASASDGSTFTGWTGGGCSGTGTCVVTVSAAVTVTATFNSGNSPVIISVASGSSSTVNTVPGGSGVFGLVLTGQTGFTGTVQLTCTSPIASITCNILPSSVTLNGTTTNVAIVVNTFCKGFIPNLEPTPGGFGTGVELLLVAFSLCGAAWTFKKQPRWAVSFGLLVVFAVGMSACSNLAKSPSGSATPPGSYPLIVTATPPSGAPSHVNLTLVVK